MADPIPIPKGATIGDPIPIPQGAVIGGDQRLSGNDVIKAPPPMFSKDWFKEKFYSGADSFSQGLPAAGATAGGLIGGGVGTAAPGPGNIAGAIGGAGIGGMAGMAGKHLFRRGVGLQEDNDPSQVANDITKEGVTQGAIQGITELLPFLGGPLRNAAVKQYERALAPTTKANKAIAQDIAPELIQRGEWGSLKGLENKAANQADQLRPELNSEYQSLQQASPTLPARNAQSGRMVKTNTGQLPGSGNQVMQDLESLKSQYMVPDAAGKMQVGNQQAIDAINGVQQVVKAFGPNISPTSLRQLKQIFDEPVAAAGGYTGTDLATHYTLNAQEAAANSIRKILHNASPDIAGLDREISFWLDVKRVAGQSALRRTGQEGGLMKVLAPLGLATAGSAGFAVGGPHLGMEAAGATALTALAAQIVRSPAWRTASAVMKDRLATALASGSVSDVAALAARFGVAATQGTPRGSQAPQSQLQTTAQ